MPLELVGEHRALNLLLGGGGTRHKKTGLHGKAAHLFHSSMSFAKNCVPKSLVAREVLPLAGVYLEHNREGS